MKTSALGPTVVMAALATSLGAIPLLVLEIDLPELQIVALRVWLGAALLLLLTRRNPFALPDGLGLRVGGVGLLLATHWFTFFYAITHTSVAVALVLVFLAPVLAATGAARVLGEAVPRPVGAALVASLLGSVLVVWGAVEVDVGGVSAGVVSAVTLAAMLIVGKPVAQAVGGLATAAAQMSAAALLLTPWIVAAVAQVPWEPARSPSALDYALPVAILGFVLTGLGALVSWWVIARLPVATVGVLSYLEPASAVLWAALVLQQQPATLSWVGVFMVIGGGVLVAVARGRDSRDFRVATP